MQPFTLRLLIPFTLVVLLLAACGDTTGDSADTTLAPATTTATTTTTAAEAESTMRADFEVTVDAEGCTMIGPATAPPGEYTFLMTNESGFDTVHFGVRTITGGHTYQDFLEYLPEPGVWVAEPPPFVVEDVIVPIVFPADVEFVGDESMRMGELVPGSYSIHTYKWDTFLWPCGPFEITDG